MKAKSIPAKTEAPATESSADEQPTKSLSTRRREWHELGQSLAAVLANPNTPAAIYNNLAAGIDEMASPQSVCLTTPAILRVTYSILAEIHENGSYNESPIGDIETADELFNRLAWTLSTVLDRTDMPKKLKAGLTMFFVELGGAETHPDLQAFTIRTQLPKICRSLAAKKGGK